MPAYTGAQLQSLWVQNGGKPAAAPLAAAIALAESSGDPNSTNHNTNGSTDRGLWQINSVHGAQSTYNIPANVRAAIAISGNGSNFGPWTTYTSGAYKQYLSGAARAALPNGASTPSALPASPGQAVTTSTLDNGAYQAARRASIAGNFLKSAETSDPYTPKGVNTGLGAGNPLVGMLGTKTPNPADYMQAHTTLQSVAQTAQPGVSVSPHPATKGGLSTFTGKPVAAWIAPILAYARAHGWGGAVTSGYRSYAQQKAIYDSGVRPAAVPGSSNHEMTAFPGGAVDVSNASQLSAILQRSPYAKTLVWAGAKDPVHFSHPHNGSY